MAGLDDAAAVRPDGPLRRVVDVALAGVALVLLAPVLAAVAIAVRLDGPGPVIFRQVRVGRDRQPFTILKFRSMVVGAATAGAAVAGAGDPRITAVGRWLRRSRLDELPQLVNVLRGEMTLFGPRAEVPEYVRHYTDEELLLLRVRPGLAGAGQLLFARSQADDLDRADDPERYYLEHQLHRKLALDLDYLRRRAVRADLALLVATARYLTEVCVLPVFRFRSPGVGPGLQNSMSSERKMTSS